eukprot:m.224698 g.224698  ORF g.224698 m.224698 type:complete len:1205 (+) comp17297_c0_seq1:198-3812(+)
MAEPRSRKASKGSGSGLSLSRLKLRRKKERSSLALVQSTREPPVKPAMVDEVPCFGDEQGYVGTRPDYEASNADLQLHGQPSSATKPRHLSQLSPDNGTIVPNGQHTRSGIHVASTAPPTTPQQSWMATPSANPKESTVPPPPPVTSPSGKPRVFRPTAVSTPAQRRAARTDLPQSSSETQLSQPSHGFQPPHRRSIAALMAQADRPKPLKAAPAYPGKQQSAPALLQPVGAADAAALLQSVSVESNTEPNVRSTRTAPAPTYQRALARTNRPVVMDEHRKLAAEEMRYLQQELLKARKDLIQVHKQLDVKERKVQASVLSIKAFWGPELEKERQARESERQRAEAAEVLLRQQESRNERYMIRIKEFQTTFEQLQSSMELLPQSKPTDSHTQRSMIDPNQASEQELKQALQENQTLLTSLEREVIQLRRAQSLQQAEQCLTQLVTGVDISQEPAPVQDTVAKAVALELQTQVDTLTAKLADLTKDNEHVREERSQLQDQVEELAQARDSLRQELSDAATEAASQQSKLTTAFETELTVMRETVTQARAETDVQVQTVEAAQAEIATATEELQSVQAQVVELTADKDQLTAALSQAEQGAAFQAELASLRSDLEQRQAEIDSLQSALSAGQKELEAVQALQLAAEEASRDWQQQLQSLQETHTALTREHASSERNLAAATEASTASDTHVAEVAAQLAQLQAQLETALQNNAELQAQLEDERANASTSHDGLKQARQALVGELAQCKTALAQAQQHVTDGKVKEEALAAELAELQNKLTEQSAQHADALDAAQSKQAGLKSQVSELQTQLKAAQAQSVEALSAQETATTELQAAAAAKEKELRVKVKQATKRQTAAETSLHQLESKVAQLTAAKEKLESQLSTKVTASRQAARTSQSQLEALQRRLTSAQRDKTSMESTVTRLQQELATSKATAISAGEALASTRANLSKLEAAKSKLAQVAADRKDELSSLRDDLGQLQRERATRAGKLEQTESKLKHKEQEIEALIAKTHELQEVIVFERTNALLSRVSDKDSRIATLEEAGAKRHAVEIKELRQEREENVRQLKEQFDARAALLSSDHNSTVDISRTEGQSTMDLKEKLENREIEARRLRKYVDQLYGEILRHDDGVAAAIMTGLPRLQQDDPYSSEQIQAMDEPELKTSIKKRDADNKQLEAYVDSLLQRIVENKPSILEVMSFSGGAHS